jgi:hypothetical protein
VFEGGGYGVGVTVVPLEPMPWLEVPPPPGVEVHPTRLGELMPVGARTRSELAAELERVGVVEGQLAAYKTEIVAAMARLSSDADDPQSGEPGAASPRWSSGENLLPEVSEFFPDELGQVLRCSRAAATTQAEVALTLVERLPAVWTALADGRLDWPRARALALELGWPARATDPEVVAEVAATVLPEAMEQSVKRLRAATHRELLARDAAAAERRRARAERAADVTVHSLGDGLAELRATMPAPLAAATREALDSYARMAQADGEQRPVGQLRVGLLADLVLRPWDSDRPRVTADLTVLAPLDALRPTASAAVAEASGQPITAAHLRELLAQLNALCPGGLQPPECGTLTLGIVDPGDGALRAAFTRPELERLVRRGCPDHPTSDCGCGVLDRPTPIDRYRPTPAQYRHVRTRDRTCRFPGCGSRAGWADVDHVIPHARGGPTECDNLCCLCRRHHRLKTHAPGWRFVLTADGVLTVTTPSGVTRTTRPPGLDLLARATGRQPPDQPDDDPPPF